MACLTAVLTHLDARTTTSQLAYLRAVCPDARFAVCHGGKRAEYERLDRVPAVFVDDDSLRGHFTEQSYTQVLCAIYRAFVEPDPGVDLIYFVEFDHLILDADFEQQLRAALERAGADFLAKNCVRRNDTNWFHYHRYRADRELTDWFRAMSRRDDPDTRYGCLGSGMLMTREALAAFAALKDTPARYLELFVPSAIHHLGFRVDDFDRVGPLYRAVRWRPEFSVTEAIDAKRRGASFVHPFKRLDALGAVRASGV